MGQKNDRASTKRYLQDILAYGRLVTTLILLGQIFVFLTLPVFFLVNGPRDSLELPNLVFYFLLPGILVAINVYHIKKSLPSRVEYFVIQGVTYLLLLGVDLLVGTQFFHDLNLKQNPSPSEVAAKLGAHFDTRTPLEFVKYQRNRGKDVWPSLSGALFVDQRDFLPLGGISKSELVQCNELGDFISYESDEYGFRNPSGSHRDKQVDALILGDSFGEGACVPEGADVSSSLRAEKYSVLNLSKSGFGPMFRLAVFREYAQGKDIKNIVWLHYKNDISDLDEEKKSAVLSRYLGDPSYSQNLKFKQKELDRWMRSWVLEALAVTPLIESPPAPKPINKQNKFSKLRFDYSWDEVKATRTLPRIRAHLGVWGRFYPQKVVAEHQVKEIFQMILGLREAAPQARIFFVFIPEYWSGRGGLYQDYVHRTLKETSPFPFVDFYEVLRAQPDRQRYYPLGGAGHLSPEGYSLLAKEIARALQTQGN